MARRFLPLDSLRGIAAAAVVIMHAQYLAKWPWITAHWAVMLFFVLSGFVLARPWADGARPPVLPFLAKRLCRLWPPVVVAVILSAALTAATEGRAAVDGSMITRCVLLSVRDGNCSLDGVLWSLTYEVRISLIFPALVWVLNRYPLFTAVAGVCFGIGVEAFALFDGTIVSGQLLVDNIAQDVIATLHYMTLFAMGIALSVNVNKLAKLGPNQATTLIAPAIGLICVPSDILRGCGAVLLIAAAIRSTGFSKALMHAPLPWLGRVSYSLYLIHVPIIAFALKEIGTANAKTAVAVGVVASLCIAEIVHRVVERPSISFGRWLAGLYRQRHSVVV
ncbi:MAG TPA: acyltransferase [Rhodopila sp.]|jgi:peptidoglycan/LPS O-acetylase OafA/YrhL